MLKSRDCQGNIEFVNNLKISVEFSDWLFLTSDLTQKHRQVTGIIIFILAKGK